MTELLLYMALLFSRRSCRAAVSLLAEVPILFLASLSPRLAQCRLADRVLGHVFLCAPFWWPVGMGALAAVSGAVSRCPTFGLRVAS